VSDEDPSAQVDAEVAQRVAAVRARIAAAAERARRAPEDITLVGVTKRQPLERVLAGIRAGVTHLGENYVQEARDKIPAIESALGGSPHLCWHLIGHLQRNKAKLVPALFDSVETVDRVELAQALDRRAQLHGERLEVLLQVNVSGESQKSGAAEDELAALWRACRDFESLVVRGLMAIPTASAEPEHNRPAFARLRELRDTLRAEPGGDDLRELSMGMSGDFEVAIEEGSTRVRVGTALFGERTEPPPIAQRSASRAHPRRRSGAAAGDRFSVS
jgi:pyridoxal phosphate enzyme (YggS family)